MKPERDIYFQKSLEEGYLARSAYKLLQIDEVFNIFDGAKRALDLCSAPGSWTQVIYKKLHNVCSHDECTSNPNIIIVSVDMMPMDHIPDVIYLQADISQYSTMKTIIQLFGNERTDVIVCDGAIDVVDMKLVDYYMHHRIFLSALYITLNVLKPGGIFVIKIFIDKGYERMIQKLYIFFTNVCIVKPHCSRNKEAFAVCRGFSPLSEFDPVQLTPFVQLENCDFSNLSGIHEILIPYLCTDFCFNMNEDYVKIMQVSKEHCEADDELIKLISEILKEYPNYISVLKKRILQKPPLYEITKDNKLEYAPETIKILFDIILHGDDNVLCTTASSLNNSNNINLEDTVLKYKSSNHLSEINDIIVSEPNNKISCANRDQKSSDDLRNIDIDDNQSFNFKKLSLQNKNFRCPSDKNINVPSVHTELKIHGKEFEMPKKAADYLVSDYSDYNVFSEKHIKIYQAFDDRVKLRKLEKEKKFPAGLDFKLDNWEFFVADMNLHGSQFEKTFQKINEKFENCPKIIKGNYIQDLLRNQEEIKTTLKDYLLETEDDD